MVLVGVLIALSAGCRAEVRSATTIRWNASGEVMLSIHVDDDAQKLLADAGLGDLLGGAAGAGRSDPFAGLGNQGWTVARAPGQVTLRHPFANPVQLAGVYAQIGGPSATSLFPSVQLRRNQGWWRTRLDFRLTVDASVDRLVAMAAPGVGRQPPAELAKVIGRPLQDVFSVSVVVAMPNVTSASTTPADVRRTGRTAWILTAGQRANIAVSAEAANPALVVAQWTIVVVLVLLVAVAVSVVVRHALRKRTPPTRTPPSVGAASAPPAGVSAQPTRR